MLTGTWILCMILADYFIIQVFDFQSIIFIFAS